MEEHDYSYLHRTLQALSFEIFVKRLDLRIMGFLPLSLPLIFDGTHLSPGDRFDFSSLN